MTSPWIERRNKQVKVQVERRLIPSKQVAAKFGITWSNLRQILFRMRHHPECNKITIDSR